MGQSPRFIRRTYVNASVLGAIVVVLFAVGVLKATFGSILIAGAILLVALAMLAKVTQWAGIVGPLLGWVYTVAFVVYIVQLIF